ncbi:glycosyltransferase family 4 protein [Algoriphagus formosus]|uniref:glycosyltransferase family 4 protein n=1 Tax=Algoriphagus formosus TaxID=2007308 RepID=UPI000C288834|nr:glycosyltransferase family 4 protein [Algoriphagus formosus]
MVLRIHYNFDLKGGAEFDILKILDVFEKYGGESWKNYLLLLTKETKGFKSKLYGTDKIIFYKTEKELKGYLNELILKLKVKIIHIHSQPYKNLTKLILDLGLPTFRSMHEAMIICPGWSKYWLKDDKPCQISFSKKCLINAYTKMCTRSRNPKNLFEAYQNVKYETEIAVKKYERVFVYSDYMKNEAISTNIPAGKIVKVPSPQYDHFKDIHKNIDEKVSIVYSGRLSKQKGIKYLVEAAHMLKQNDYVNFEVLIFGDGPDKDSLVAQTTQLDLNDKIVFYGWVERKQLIEHYKTSHISVIPSTYPDNFPNTVAESMLAKMVVIAFDSGGTCEWFDDGLSGFKTKTKNAIGIFTELQKLMKSKNKILKIGEAARNKILSTHSLGSTFDTYNKYYNKVLK